MKYHIYVTNELSNIENDVKNYFLSKHSDSNEVSKLDFIAVVIKNDGGCELHSVGQVIGMSDDLFILKWLKKSIRKYINCKLIKKYNVGMYGPMNIDETPLGLFVI